MEDFDDGIRSCKSAEQQARDLLEKYGLEDAQSMTSGDVVELANAIARSYAWEIIYNSARFPEVREYAQRREITWAAAVVELVNAGLSQQQAMATDFPTCGFEASPNGDIRLWVGDTDGANGPPLSDDQINALIRNLTAAMGARGRLDVTWVA
jgi:hypothetical protein